MRGLKSIIAAGSLAVGAAAVGALDSSASDGAGVATLASVEIAAMLPASALAMQEFPGFTPVPITNECTAYYSGDQCQYVICYDPAARLAECSEFGL